MSIQVMKQALEALTEHGAPYLRHGVDWDNAIAALRAAIAEQEKAEPVAVLQTDYIGRFLECVYRGQILPADQWGWKEETRVSKGKFVPLYTHPAPVPADQQLVELVQLMKFHFDTIADEENWGTDGTWESSSYPDEIAMEAIEAFDKWEGK